MPDVQYQKLIPYDSIEDEIWVMQDWYTPMPGVVDYTANAGQNTQCSIEDLTARRTLVAATGFRSAR